MNGGSEDRAGRARGDHAERIGGRRRGGGAAHGLGLIGSAVHSFQQADTSWLFVLAVPKAIVWPAIVVYELLKTFYG